MKGNARAGLLLALCTITVPVCAYTMEGLRADSLASAVCAGAALGAMHWLLKPLLALITAPIGCLTFGLSSFAIDVGLIYLAAWALGGFHVTQFSGPVFTALAVNLLSALLIRKR